MKAFPLLRRKEVWVPTWFGWLVLIAVLALLAGAAFLFVHPFLAPTGRATGAELLVVEGWMPAEELDQAIELFQAGGYRRIATTGGPLDKRMDPTGVGNYAELAARYLVSRGISPEAVSAVPAPASAQDRTFLSAVRLRRWMEARGGEARALDLVSSGAHARRSRLLYRMAFGPGTEIGIVALRPSEYDPRNWWKTSNGAKTVLAEVLAYAWTLCCFDPPAPGTKEELWGAADAHPRPG